MNPTKQNSFKKEKLNHELLQLNHPKITPQIAQMISNDIEKEINKNESRKNISQILANKLEELGLMPSSYESDYKPKTQDDLSFELLHFLSQTKEEPIKAPIEKKETPISLIEGINFDLFEKTCGLKDKDGIVSENADQIIWRLANAVSLVELKYNPTANLSQLKKQFYNLVAQSYFMPVYRFIKNVGGSLKPFCNQITLNSSDFLCDSLKLLNEISLLNQKGISCIINLTQFSGNKNLVHTTTSFLKLLQTWEDEILNNTHIQNTVLINSDDLSILQILNNQQIKPAYSIFFKVKTDSNNNELFHFLNKYHELNLYFDSDEIFNTSFSGIINLSRFVKNGEIRWFELSKAVTLAVHFLDNALEIQSDKEFNFKKERRISLSICGFYELLNSLSISYLSDEAYHLAEKISLFIKTNAEIASITLAKKRGGLNDKKRNSSLMSQKSHSMESLIFKVSSSFDNPTSVTISPKWNLKLQSAFQKNCDGGVFKICPLFEKQDLNSFEDLILEAKKLNLKTVLFKKYYQIPIQTEKLSDNKKIKENFEVENTISKWTADYFKP